MIKMQEDLRSILVSSPVGALVSNRISWGIRPQSGIIPSLVLSQIAGVPYYVYSGKIAYTQTRVQYEVFTADYGSGQSIFRACVDAISGFKGVVGETEFLGILLIGLYDDTEEVGTASQQVVRTVFETYCYWSEKETV